MAMVSLLSALVLGLLVATAKNKFDTSNREVEEFAANLMRLDRELSNYGEEAKEIRPLLKQFAMAKLAASWPARGAGSFDSGEAPQWRLLENVQRKLRALSPQTDSQHATLASALEIVNELSKTSWLQRAEEPSHVPHPFILILIVWLFLLFVSFGFFAPFNALTVTALLICAASLAGAIALSPTWTGPSRASSPSRHSRWRTPSH
jgi:hypothetical protein